MAERTEEKRKEREHHFREKLKKLYGNKYEYDTSVLNFTNTNNKGCFICHEKDENGIEHGAFITKLYYLITGHGCPKCGRFKTINARKDIQETFINKCKQVHGDKYDYSKVKYINSRTKVCIICPEHGEFWVTPGLFIKGTNCPVCGRINAHKKKTNTTSYFINKAKKVHKDKYDYSKSYYTKSRNILIVTCPIHGDFKIKANAHLNGHGCPKCANEQNSLRKKFTVEQFIEKAKEVHGDKYDYSKTVYVDANTKVCIICPEHGEFWQKPLKHINMKQGCPKCNQSHLEREVMQLLENNNIKYEYQKRFEWLGQQSLDFYLPEYNTAIECQGEQHFRPVSFGGNKIDKEKNYIIIYKRDVQKLKLCKKYNIKMLYYSNYKKIPENYMEQGCIINTNDLINNILNDGRSK